MDPSSTSRAGRSVRDTEVSQLLSRLTAATAGQLCELLDSEGGVDASLKRLERAGLITAHSRWVRRSVYTEPLFRPGDTLYANRIERVIRDRFGPPTLTRVYSSRPYRSHTVDHEVGLTDVLCALHRAAELDSWELVSPAESAVNADALVVRRGVVTPIDFLSHSYRAARIRALALKGVELW